MKHFPQGAFRRAYAIAVCLISLTAVLAIASSINALAATTNYILTGHGANGPGVKAFNGMTLTGPNFLPYGAGFTGEVRVAAGDINGDGTDDFITGPGPGNTSNVKVFDGLTLTEIRSFLAFPGFTGGIFVASGDVNGDGREDIIVGTDSGTAATVSVFSGVDSSLIRNFAPYGSLTCGVRVGVTDRNGDGRADILTSTGPGVGPNVKVFDGATLGESANFFAFDPGFTGGIYVAGGDINDDHRGDIIVGTGSGTTAQIKVFSGADLSELRNFLPFGAGFTGGVTVAATEINCDYRADIIVGAGPGGGPQVMVFSGLDNSTLANFFAYNPSFLGGIYVGGGFNAPHPRLLSSDFDSDGLTDIAVWQGNSTGHWLVRRSSDGLPQGQNNWGIASLGDIPVPGDYDGDGRTDYAVYRPSEGNWYIIRSSTGTILRQNWGAATDVPVPGDYNGDLMTDFAVYRPSEGHWFIRFLAGGAMSITWGLGTDTPVPADYDNDGKTDEAIWRPSEGNWYIKKSTGGASVRGWGTSGDKLVPADYDGDGMADIAVYRAGVWYIINSCSGGITVKSWGTATDIPVPGDYDGDDRADIAVWRPSESNWYIIQSATNTGKLLHLGQSSDTPVPAAYLPQ